MPILRERSEVRMIWSSLLLSVYVSATKEPGLAALIRATIVARSSALLVLTVGVLIVYLTPST